MTGWEIKAQQNSDVSWHANLILQVIHLLKLILLQLIDIDVLVTCHVERMLQGSKTMSTFLVMFIFGK